MVLRKRLVNLIVGERDLREKEIKILLEKALREWPNDLYLSKKYINQAIDIKEKIEKEKGKIYFKKYPDIPYIINNTIIQILSKYE